MGLMPLEYKDCLTDSPFFRQKLQGHEKELDQTSHAIKSLVKELKELIHAARTLSRAQRNLSLNLQRFKFQCIGGSQTDDEVVISHSLNEFAKIINTLEDERERMLDNSEEIVSSLERFRKSSIGGAKAGRKKFDKQTQKFYQSQERYLGLSTKKEDQVLKEADAAVGMEQRHFIRASLEYVFLLQEVQERKKFEFVETLLRFMYSWLTFYRHGQDVFSDCKNYMVDLQQKVQRKSVDPGSIDKMYTRQGYLFLMEKKAFGTTWTKHYCQFQKESRIFSMIPYNQVQQKFSSTETIRLKSCIRRMSDTIDKRFCFDITAQDKPGVMYTLQALSEDDRKLWMDAMDGKEPNYGHPSGIASGQEETRLDEMGQTFIGKAISVLEGRGLEDQGLYRLVGVSSKVSKLLSIALDNSQADKLLLDDASEWEVKTITSAVKQYFRNLPEPLMTHRLHSAFIAAAKQDELSQRIRDIHKLVYQLPKTNFLVLKSLIQHLVNGPDLQTDFMIHMEEVPKDPSSSSLSSSPTSPPRLSKLGSGGKKHSQPVLQTVVTSFTTSEPQTVHFGGSSGHHMQRSDGTSNLKGNNYNMAYQTTSTTSRGSHYVPPPPTATHWGRASSLSSHNTGPINDGGEVESTNSSSSESISSREVLGHLPSSLTSSPQTNKRYPSSTSLAGFPTVYNGGGPLREGGRTGVYNNSTKGDAPHVRVRRQHHVELSANTSSASATLASLSSGNSASSLQPRQARTLYACVAENESELSFDPNQIVTDVKPSKEPGWLQGTLNGTTGLIPHNYVEFIEEDPPQLVSSHRNTEV